jgi:CRISPR-associated protein Csm3
MATKLIKKIEFQGKLVLKTGLHIGGTNSSMQIGGIDKSVIRNPITNQPFIPGSSLKGKLRSLLEVSMGIIGPPVTDKVQNGPAKVNSPAELFGNALSDKEKDDYLKKGILAKNLPSRVIVRDCELMGAVDSRSQKFITVKEFEARTEIPFTEGKTEVVIDRITSTATPRQIERIPAGAVFTLSIILNIWEQDNNESLLMENLFKSFELLKDDYLGGNGSRGYGQVSIEIEHILEKSTDDYFGKENSKPKDRTNEFSTRINKLKS